MSTRNSTIPPVKVLRAVCQAPEATIRDTWVGRNVGRRATIYFTWLLLHTGINANQTTLLWLSLDLAAGGFFLLGSYWCSVAAALAILLAWILDGTDGEIARYRGQSSLKGQYLDEIAHTLSFPFIFACISFNVYASSHDWRAFIFGFCAAGFQLMMRSVNLSRFYILLSAGKTGSQTASVPSAANQSDPAGFSALLRILRRVNDPTGEEIIVFACLLAAALKGLYPFIIVYGILLPLRWLFQLSLNLKRGFPTAS